MLWARLSGAAFLLTSARGTPRADEKVSFAMKIRIQKARTAKGMTQKQLAQAIGQRPSVINEYESGKTIPDNGILGKIERALGVKLRGDLSKKPGGKGGKKKKK